MESCQEIRDSKPTESNRSSLINLVEQPFELHYQITQDFEPFWSHDIYRGLQNERVKRTYCDTLAQSEEAAQRLSKVYVLGFDIEWRGYGKFKTIGENISMIQLATEDEVVLFHIARHPDANNADTKPGQLIAPTLKAILESSYIIKAGKCKGDLSKLRGYLNLNPRGYMDVTDLAKTVGKVTKLTTSLADLVNLTFGKPLNKPTNIVTSRWDRELVEAQLHYAAADAYAGLMLFHELNNGRLEMHVPGRPQLPSCVRPNAKTKKAKPSVADSEVSNDTAWSQSSLESSTSSSFAIGVVPCTPPSSVSSQPNTESQSSRSSSSVQLEPDETQGEASESTGFQGRKRESTSRKESRYRKAKCQATGSRISAHQSEAA